jgi:hypothetical protein
MRKSFNHIRSNSLVKTNYLKRNAACHELETCRGKKLAFDLELNVITNLDSKTLFVRD